MCTFVLVRLEAASAAWLVCELGLVAFVIRQMVECAALLPVACICLRPAVMGRHTLAPSLSFQRPALGGHGRALRVARVTGHVDR